MPQFLQPHPADSSDDIGMETQKVQLVEAPLPDTGELPAGDGSLLDTREVVLPVHREPAEVSRPSSGPGAAGTEPTARGSAEILAELLEIPDFRAVVIVGRDVFVIESAGASAAVAMDHLGAALAYAITGIEAWERS